MKTVTLGLTPVIRFKQFKRKGYSLFACLGKVVSIGVLSVATLQQAKAAALSVETFRTDTDSVSALVSQDLDEAVVSGTLVPLPGGADARMVTVWQPQDIQAAAAPSVNDLLKLAPGVDVRQRAPLGAQTDISLRGGNAEQIAILLDGVCVSDPQTGHNTLDLPVQLSEIQRIEIVEGPAAKAYGAQSLLGAINIVTKRPDRTATQVAVEGGSYGYVHPKLTLRLPTVAGRLSGSLSGSYARSDGFSRARSGALNTDYSGYKAHYRGALSLDREGGRRLDWALGLAHKAWGSSTSYGPGSDEQWEQTGKYSAQVRASLPLKGGWHLLPAAYWQQNRDLYAWQRGVSSPNRHCTNLYGVSLNARRDWNTPHGSPWRHFSGGGAEVRHEHLISSAMPETQRTQVSAHLDHEVRYRRWSLSAGVMAFYNTLDGQPLRLYPGVDVSCRLTDEWKLYAAWNRSMRLPSFTELYYMVDGHRADPHLNAEKMGALETGVKYASFYGQAALALYGHRGTNLIDWILDTRLGPEAVWTSVNHARLDSYGAELQTTWQADRIFPSQRWLKTICVGYHYLHQQHIKEDYIQSGYALEYLRHKWVAGLDFSLYSGRVGARPGALELFIDGRVQDRVGGYTDADGRYCTYRPYALVDAKLSFRLAASPRAARPWNPDYGAFVAVNNLLNQRYVEIANVEQPGAWVTVGLQMGIGAD